MNLKNNSFIDLNLYNIFYTVYKCGSFSKAAEKLYVTQPAISYSIKKLEEILGITLFIRDKNVLKITEETEEIIPYIEEALINFNLGKQRIEEKLNLRNSVIKIGIPSHIGIFLLVDIIEKFSKDNPNINIKVVCKTTKELFRLLKNNRIDILIDSSPIEEVPRDEYVIYKISEENYCFACSVKNKDIKKVSLEDLLKYKLIVPSKNTNATTELGKLFEDNNLILEPNYEIDTSEMIVEMIQKNIGIGYLYEKMIDRKDDIRKIDISEKLPTSDIFIIYKKKMLAMSTKKIIEYINDNISNYK